MNLFEMAIASKMGGGNKSLYAHEYQLYHPTSAEKAVIRFLSTKPTLFENVADFSIAIFEDKLVFMGGFGYYQGIQYPVSAVTADYGVSVTLILSTGEKPLTQITYNEMVNTVSKVTKIF